MKAKGFRKKIAIGITLTMMLSLAACGKDDSDKEGVTATLTEVTADTGTSTETTADTITTADSTTVVTEDTTTEAVSTTESDISTVPNKDDIKISETLSNNADGEHAILADGEKASYSNVKVEKTGESSGDEADFYGENAAVFATNGATLDLSNIVVETNGTHANGVFSYGEGTTINISDSVIETTGNCSGGLMTTGGGTMNATNLYIHTTGNSSAAIRSDRGGGTVTVTGGDYSTEGKGSPAIYSTADITVNDAVLTSTSSQGVVVEGKNSVTLNNVDLAADNNSKNSDKSSYYQAVMIYQSMSGDAAEGDAAFTMNGGSIININGDIFFVNNTVADINLSDVDIENCDEDGVFLRAAAAGWGNEGSNGGKVNLNASDQEIEGDILVDSVSALNFYLSNESDFEGAINPDGQEGEVYVEISDGALWRLTGDSYITSLTCDEDSIELGGYTLYVNGVAYTKGTASTGEKITLSSGSSGGSGGDRPDAPPDGNGGSGEKPDGNGGPGGDGGEPPAKPED